MSIFDDVLRQQPEDSGTPDGNIFGSLAGSPTMDRTATDDWRSTYTTPAYSQLSHEENIDAPIAANARAKELDPNFKPYVTKNLGGDHLTNQPGPVDFGGLTKGFVDTFAPDSENNIFKRMGRGFLAGAQQATEGVPEWGHELDEGPAGVFGKLFAPVSAVAGGALGALNAPFLDPNSDAFRRNQEGALGVLLGGAMTHGGPEPGVRVPREPIRTLEAPRALREPARPLALGPGAPRPAPDVIASGPGRVINTTARELTPEEKFRAQIQASLDRQKANPTPTNELGNRYPVSERDPGAVAPITLADLNARTGGAQVTFANRVGKLRPVGREDLTLGPKVNTVPPVPISDLRARIGSDQWRPNVPLDSEQLAARIGATSPAQRAVTENLKTQVAAREAQAAEPRQATGTLGASGMSGPLVGRAIGRGNSQLARTGLKSEGLTASPGDLSASLARQAKVHDANEAVIAAVKSGDKAAEARARADVKLLGGDAKHTDARVRAATNTSVSRPNTPVSRVTTDATTAQDFQASIDALKAKGGKAQGPTWVTDEIGRRIATADRLGVSGRIEQLSRERLTAQQVADRLASEGKALTGDVSMKDVVRAVRADRGIPSMDDRAAFEAWAKKGNKNVPPTTGTPPRVPEGRTGRGFLKGFSEEQGGSAQVGPAAADVRAARDLLAPRDKGYVSGPFTDAERAAYKLLGRDLPNQNTGANLHSSPAPKAAPGPARGATPPPNINPQGTRNTPPLAPFPKPGRGPITMGGILRGVPRAAGIGLREGVGLLKTTQTAGAPLHALDRHLSPLGLSHPIANLRAAKSGLVTFGNFLKNPENARTTMADTVARYRSNLLANSGPQPPRGTAPSGAARIEIRNPHGSGKTGEDFVPSRLLNKIPGLGRVIEGSQAAFSMSQNTARYESFKGSMNQYRRLLGRPLTEAEKGGIADRINHFSGRGFRTEGDIASKVGQLSNVGLYSPQLQSSYGRMAGDIVHAVAHPRSIESLETLRLAGGLMGKVAIYTGIASALGLSVDLDPQSGNFLKVDLGPRDAVRGAIAGLGSQFGEGTITESNGHVYLDLTHGMASYIRTVAQTVAQVQKKDPTFHLDLGVEPKYDANNVGTPVGNLLANHLGPGAYDLNQLRLGNQVKPLNDVLPISVSGAAEAGGWNPPTAQLRGGHLFKDEAPADIQIGGPAPAPSGKPRAAAPTRKPVKR